MPLPRPLLTAVVIGAGAGGTLSINALLASERFELVGVADLRPEALDHVREQTGGSVPTFGSAEEMFETRPSDIVCVSTYAPSHLALTRSALSTGVVQGMLVEKPLGDTTAAGREILDLLRSHNRPVVIPHGLMAQSAAVEVVRQVRSGSVGDLLLVEIECTGWDIINAGIHWLQFFLALVDPAPVEVVLTAADSSTRTFRDGMQVETEALTMARTTNGIRALMNTGDTVPLSRDTTCLMRIIGSHGYLEYGAWESWYTLVSPGRDRVRIDVPAFAVSGHQRHLEHLADQIESGDRDYRIPNMSLQALEVVEAAYLSNRIGATVHLPLDSRQEHRGQGWEPGRPYGGTGGGRNGRQLT
jgi:predicted dehydrogenase